MYRFCTGSCVSFQLPIIGTPIRNWFQKVRRHAWTNHPSSAHSTQPHREVPEVCPRAMWQTMTAFQPHHWWAVPPLAGPLTSLALSFLISKKLTTELLTIVLSWCVNELRYAKCWKESLFYRKEFFKYWWPLLSGFKFLYLENGTANIPSLLRLVWGLNEDTARKQGSLVPATEQALRG